MQAPSGGACWGKDQPHHQSPWGRAGLQGEESARIPVVSVPGAGLSIYAYALYLIWFSTVPGDKDSLYLSSADKETEAQGSLVTTQ